MSALCSARILGPILKVIDEQGEDTGLVPEEFRGVDPDDRIPLMSLLRMLDECAERFGDEQLGLAIGGRSHFGEVGPFDYLVRSAATTREAVEVAGRYSVLQGDSYRIGFETWRNRALIRLFDETSWSRPMCDFSMASGYRFHVSVRTPYVSRVECWFPYPEPDDLTRYEQIFQGAALRFNAPFSGFSVEGGYESAPQPGADPILHSILRERFDLVVSDLARSFALKTRVRRLIEAQLQEGLDAAAPLIANKLEMSRRTLSRKLKDEGTSFADELDAVRCEMALQYVCSSQRPIGEIAFLLGFAHVESFYRAFKRWTGVTPLMLRETPVLRPDPHRPQAHPSPFH